MTSQLPFSRMICSHCEGPLEFPPEAEGRSISCPHCNAQITLAGRLPHNTPVLLWWPESRFLGGIVAFALAFGLGFALSQSAAVDFRDLSYKPMEVLGRFAQWVFIPYGLIVGFRALVFPQSRPRGELSFQRFSGWVSKNKGFVQRQLFFALFGFAALVYEWHTAMVNEQSKMIPLSQRLGELTSESNMMQSDKYKEQVAIDALASGIFGGNDAVRRSIEREGTRAELIMGEAKSLQSEAQGVALMIQGFRSARNLMLGMLGVALILIAMLHHGSRDELHS